MNGWKEEVSIISHRRVTSSGSKQERPGFTSAFINIFATGCSSLRGNVVMSHGRTALETGRSRVTSLDTRKGELKAGYRIY